ncbi:hypothetical protein FQA39_LY08776 [Lamprigera yunnana]|nr:hypothetical protein FQA39_LY08776 [Lamprigera yunnana]
MGRPKQYLVFKEQEWTLYDEQRENINKYFQTFDTMWKSIQIGLKALTLEMIEEKKILWIADMCGNKIYLGSESVPELWSIESVLSYRLSYSSGSNLKHFYEDMCMLYAEQHWTKAIDLKSAVERIHEKLSASETYADNEAIYGMESFPLLVLAMQLNSPHCGKRFSPKDNVIRHMRSTCPNKKDLLEPEEQSKHGLEMCLKRKQ